MRLSLTGRHIDVTPALRQLVTRRLERLERVFNDTLVSAQVVLSKERHLHQAELIVHARGDHTLSAIGGGATWARRRRRGRRQGVAAGAQGQGQVEDAQAPQRRPPRSAGRRGRRARRQRRRGAAACRRRRQGRPRGGAGHPRRRRAQDALRGEADGPRRRRRALPRRRASRSCSSGRSRPSAWRCSSSGPTGASGSSIRRAERRAARTSAWPTRLLRVTVDALVRASIAAGVELEVLAGRAGLDRTVDNPVPAEDRAGAGRLRRVAAGRSACSSSAQSEVRYLDVAPGRRRRGRRRSPRVFSRGIACVVVTKRLEPPRWPGRGGRHGAACRCCAPTLSTPVAFAKLGALLDDRLAPRTSLPRRARRRARPRRADGGGERHRQERVRARADRPRPPPGRPTTSSTSAGAAAPSSSAPVRR